MMRLLKMKKFFKKNLLKNVRNAKNGGLKSSKKKKKETVNEKALWGRLNKLNENFAKIKNIQKQNKNKFSSFIRQ